MKWLKLRFNQVPLIMTEIDRVSAIYYSKWNTLIKKGLMKSGIVQLVNKK